MNEGRSVSSHLDEFFFWDRHGEVEMTEAAGNHGAQFEVETLLGGGTI